MAIQTLVLARVTLGVEELIVEVDYNGASLKTVAGACLIGEHVPSDRGWRFVYRAEGEAVEVRGRGRGIASFVLPPGTRLVVDTEGNLGLPVRSECQVGLG